MFKELCIRAYHYDDVLPSVYAFSYSLSATAFSHRQLIVNFMTEWLLPANFSTTSTAEAIGFAPPPRYDARDAHPFDVRGCVLEFTLSEGRKHQIRKVCRKVGLRVVDLYRVTIGPWDVAGLPEGAWRPLNQTEIGRIGPKLRGSLEASSKMQAGSNRKPFD